MATNGDVPIVEVKQVVVVKFLRGKGVTDDPYRRVTAYYSFEGELLAENDPAPTKETT